MAAQEKLQAFAKNEEMNVVVILLPEVSRSAETSTKSYGSYEMPMAASSHLNRRQQAEEPIAEEAFESSPATAVAVVSQVSESSASNTTYAPLKGVIPFCHASLDACISATNNCSGHGSCYGKSNSTDGKSGCYSCGCLPSVVNLKKDGFSKKTTHWGGAACNKEDISGQFWLLAGFSIVLVGVVGTAIGMMFSIGEEKLPGVIGAGVSSKSR